LKLPNISVAQINWNTDNASENLADAVDYAALGGRNFIGNPKQPTISVCNLVDGEYQISKFRDNERIISQTFPELNLTANQIFQAGVV
jgi:Uma2 family endonuclease